MCDVIIWLVTFNPKISKSREASMGRKLINPTGPMSGKERTKRSRDLKRLNGIPPETAEVKITNAQRRWETYKKYKTLKSGMLSLNEKIFLCQKYQTNEYAIIIRSFDPVTSSTSSKVKKDLLEDDAQKEYNEIINENKRGPYWVSFDYYREQAYKFIADYESGKKDFWGNQHLTLGFLAMLNEIHEDEGLGEIDPPAKNITPSARKRRRNIRRQLVSFLSDFTLDKKIPIDEIEELIKKIMKMIAHKSLKEHGKNIRISTYRMKVEILRDIFEVMSEFRRVYPKEIQNEILITIKKNTSSIIESYKKKKHSNAEDLGFTKGDNNPYIPLPELKIILDLAWNKSACLYYFIVLNLTVGLREDEMRRLINNPRYILSNGTLDYNNSAGIDDVSQWLIQKTDESVDITKLTNPMLSIVARMILNYEKPSPYPDDFFEKRKGKFRMMMPELEKYHERCLRTTCATMLAYCSKLKGFGASSYLEIAERLAHVDTSTATTTYAPRVPKSISPAKYFNTNPHTLTEEVCRHFKIINFKPDTIKVPCIAWVNDQLTINYSSKYFHLKGDSEKVLSTLIKLGFVFDSSRIVELNTEQTKFLLSLAENQQVLKHDYDLSKDSTLWDTWLLNDFCSRKMSTFKTEEEKNMFRQLCIKEAKIYNHNMADDENFPDEQRL